MKSIQKAYSEAVTAGTEEIRQREAFPLPLRRSGRTVTGGGLASTTTSTHLPLTTTPLICPLHLLLSGRWGTLHLPAQEVRQLAAAAVANIRRPAAGEI